MCAPIVMQEVVRSMSRRDVLRLGAAAAASLVATGTGLAAAGDPDPVVGASPHPVHEDEVSFDEPLRLRLSRMLDLTHTLSGAFPVIPVPGITFPFKQTPIATFESMGLFANKWEMIDHNGTHIDATNHFNPLGYSLEQTPLRSLFVPLVVIDIAARAARDPDTTVTADDLRSWEKRHGRIPADAAVFMDSGWDSRAADTHAFLNTDASGTMHFPGFSLEAIDFLLRERRISGIGVDTISFDPGTDHQYLAHKRLFGGGRWGIENIKNLGRAPRSGAHVFIGATKVEGASGGPARILALW